MGLDLGRRSIVALGLLLLLAAPLAAQEDVADLIADLQSKDEYVRKLARDALVSKGESALEPVLGLLEHEDARLRTQALLILEGMGPKASRAVPRLRKIAAEDPNRDVRKLALSALLRIEPQMPVPMSDLIRMLKSSEDHQIEIAAETIMTLGPQAREAQPILIKLLQERQGAAVAAVRRKATPEEVARAVRAPEAQLRVPLARALGATAVASESGQTALLDHAMLQGHLFGLLPPEDLESLAASGARVLVVLVQRWSDYVRGRDAWVYELAARIGVKAEDPILHVLREGNALEKTRAIDLLKAMGPSGGVSVATLIGALDDPAAAVRRGSAGALGSMGQAASAAVPALVELLRDKEMRSRLWAALALGQILGIGQRALSPRDQRKLIAQEGIGGGLEWLAAHQDVDGNGMWDCDAFMKHDPAGDKCDGPGRALYDPGVTGLALLAFLGAGCTDRDTPYANNVHMGLRYLSSIQDVEGCFGPRNNQHFVYNHAIATLAMCEAWAMTRNPRYKKPAQDGLNWISRARNPGLAWRYGVRPGDNDTSVTGWMVMALKAGTVGGLDVDPDAFNGARAWVGKMTDSKNGVVGYIQPGGVSARPADVEKKFPAAKTQSMTAVGILTRILLGANPKTSNTIRRGAGLCLRLVPVWDTEDGSIDMYYWYYGSLALYQVGGNAWKTWSKAMVPCILKNQFPKGSGARTGSWDPIGPWGPDGGRVYATAMMVLCLETPYRYRRVHSARPQLTKSVLEALRAAARDEDKVLAQAAAESLAAIGSE